MYREFIDRLTTIIINQDYIDLIDIRNNSLTLSICAYGDSDALEMTNLLLQKYNLSERNPQIYVKIDITSFGADITSMLSIPISELHIEYFALNFHVPLRASGEFPHCPILTHLTIVRFHIDESVHSELRKAIHNGKLPNLRRVTLKGCCEHSSRLDCPDAVEVSVLYDEEFKRYEKHGCEICTGPLIKRF